MKYNVEEMYRNEAIVEVLKERDELYSNEDIVELVKEIDESMPQTEMVYKVTIRLDDVQGYMFEKYLGLDDVQEIIENNNLDKKIELALAYAVKDSFKNRIEEIKIGRY